MSLDSPPEIIPYARFLEARQRRHERATAPSEPEPVAPAVNVLPESTDAAVEKAVAVTASADVVSDLGW